MRHFISYIYLPIILMGLGCINILTAQESVSKRGKPFGYNHQSFIEKASSQKIPARNLDSIKQRRDSLRQKELKPYKIGYKNKVNIELTAPKNWKTVGKDDSIAYLSFHVKQAKAVNILFDKFWLPKGSQLYIYNKQKTHFIGPYTDANNNGDRSSMQGFCSGIVAGNQIILEYHPPKKTSLSAVISLESVVHIYKPPQFLATEINRTLNTDDSDFGLSGDCMVNVNCSPEGDDWQDEKKSVVMVYNGESIFTGFLVNNTNSDDTPFLITADHCIGGAYESGDTIANNTYFMYESADCPNSIQDPPEKELGAGMTLLANSYLSDFELLKLNRDPKEVLSNDSIYYAGWDRTNDQDSGGVCIHHPSGDVKKISTVDGTPNHCDGYPYEADYWQSWWKNTLNGFSITEAGSSGSPLFNSDSKVIGQLWGACISDSNCTAPQSDDAAFGKIYSSWDGSNKEERLKDWLDPLGNNPKALDGRYAGSQAVNPCEYDADTVTIENTTIISDTTYSTQCSYTVRNATIDNNASVTLNHQWKTVIEKDFEVKSGSTFEVQVQ